MPNLLEIIFIRTWWEYSPNDGQWFTALYHWFNIAEGGAWLTFATLVVRRFNLNRHSRLELYYAAAFATFAVTDFREAWAQSSWLIWIKLINLIVLLMIRRVIMKRYYPNAKVY